MDALQKNWNGEKLVIRYDEPANAWIIIAIHSSKLGPPTGGTRMKPYPDFSAALEDALKLSKAMTYKFAVPGIARGGGKAVIAIPTDLKPNTRAGLLRRYGELIRQLDGKYTTGPDVGTSPEDMDIIAETGAPYVHCRTPEAGGVGSSGPITALGVFTGIQTSCEYEFGDASLTGKRVLVQGTGSVGEILITLLREAGAEVLFSEVDDRAIHRFRDDVGLEFVPPEKVFETGCDIYSPNAMGGVLTAESIPKLGCKIVTGGANNQLAEPEDAERLRRRGILYAPDYVVNSGAAIGIPMVETEGWPYEKAEQLVVKSIRDALRQVCELAERQNITTEAAARRIAEQRLATAN